MSNEIVRLTPGSDHSVILTPIGSVQDISFIPGILSAFEAQARQQVRHFTIDLQHVAELSPSLIVLLLELTARARRRGGDVALIHFNDRALQDLTSFDLLGYLHIATMEPGSGAAALPVGAGSLNGSRENAKDTSVLELPSRADVVYKACDFVVAAGRRMGFSENEINKIKLAVYEACLNVVEHAYHSDPTKIMRVTVQEEAQRLVIQVIDRGDGFEVSNDNFDVMAAAAARQTGGMGLHIIRRSMDEVNYQRNSQEGNKLIMIKNFG
jgi:anti-sigma regulatory factor (Ser/Thr protein kinase)/anti-anti-sigma regulatory factor